MNDNKILRLPDVIKHTGLSRSSIYAAISAGAFPKPIKIGARAIGFLSAEIDTWIMSRAQARVTEIG